jgi:hypothetical protein
MLEKKKLFFGEKKVLLNILGRFAKFFCGALGFRKQLWRTFSFQEKGNNKKDKL